MFPISLKSLNNQERHDYILKTFVLNNEKSTETQRVRRDIDVIRDNHQFLWDDNNPPDDSWEVRLSKRYYDKLFKEYCIADLSRYKDNKIALRWRTEAEVVTGKGQFQCGSRKCEQRNELRSWEVNFAYQEHDMRKNALVKLRLCPEHSMQLNYRSRKREIKRLKRAQREELQEKKHQKRKRKHKSHKEKIDSSRGDDTEETGTPPENLIPTEACVPSNEKFTSESPHANNLIGEADVWSKKQDVELDTKPRETDFERYLEDLLL